VRADAVAADPGRRARLLIFGLFAGYMLLAAGLYYFRGFSFITPDRWAFFLFLGAALVGQGLAFLRDWVPFVLLLFGYEFMRGVAGDVVTADGYTAEEHGRILVQPLIDAERFLCGGIPTVWLQERLYEPGRAHWYDVLAGLVYLLHFVFPLVFAFLLWLRWRDRFWRFSLAMLLMTYLAFFFFLLLPSAPPWLAERWGYVEGIARPSGQAYRVLLPNRYDNLDTFTIWTHRSPNPVAALPSLHAAFPWLVLLFAVRFYGRRAWLFLLYNAAVWFSVVYLAQHWVIDILAGIAWATVSFYASEALWRWLSARTGQRSAGRARLVGRLVPALPGLGGIAVSPLHHARRLARRLFGATSRI
jgi:hypothetical protein